MTMGKLISSLKTYKVLKKLGKSKSKPKVEKNLVPKATKETPNVEYKETTYIAKWIIKALKISKAIPRKKEFSRYITDGKGNNACQKYGKPSQYIMDCPLYKVEYKEYIKQNSEKKRWKKQVTIKYNKKAKADRVAMQVIAALSDSLYDIDESEQHEDVSTITVKDYI